MDRHSAHAPLFLTHGFDLEVKQQKYVTEQEVVHKTIQKEIKWENESDICSLVWTMRYGLCCASSPSLLDTLPLCWYLTGLLIVWCVM